MFLLNSHFFGSVPDDILDFINQLQERELLTEFDEQVWRGLVDHITIFNGGRVEFQYLDGCIKVLHKNDF